MKNGTQGRQQISIHGTGHFLGQTTSGLLYTRLCRAVSTSDKVAKRECSRWAHCANYFLWGNADSTFYLSR